MKTWKITIKIFVVLFLTFTWTTTSVSAEEGVTDTSLRIGSHMDLSGVIAYWGNNLRMGLQSYFNQVNEQGGVHGRKIDFIVEDDQYKPPLSIAAAKKLISKDKIFAFVGPMGAQQAGATMKLAIEKKIPFILPLSSASIFFKPLNKYVFSLFMPYEDQGGVMVDYAFGKLNAKKIGVIYQEDEVGKSGEEGVEAQLKKYNKKLVISIPFKRGAKDFSSQVLKLRESGVDLVIIASTIAEPAAITKEAVKLGWKPQFMCQSSTGTNPYFIKMAGPACEGTIVATQALLPFSSAPGVVKYRETLKKYFPKADPGFMSQVGYTVAMVFTEALKIAGKDLTRGKLIQSMEGIKNFDSGIYPPISFSSTNHLGTDACFLAKVEGGKFIKVTDYLRPK
jgi:branched-chain amino acid transport system substrate-binding protein